MFIAILKLISFWKMVRLDLVPTPDKKCHWAAFRNMRRTVLFGTSDPPTEKTAVELKSNENQLSRYTRAVTDIMQKENKVLGEISYIVCQSIGIP